MNAHATIHGRELPNNVEAEQALLGAIMLNNDAMDALPEAFDADDMHEELHRRIYRAALDIRKAGRGVSPISLSMAFPADLKIVDTPMKLYLIRLTSDAVSVINAPDHARAIMDLSVRRRAIAAMRDAQDALSSPDHTLSAEKEITACAGALEAMADRLTAANQFQGSKSGNYAKSLQRTRSQGGDGVPFPLNELAAVLSESGFEGGNLYGLLAASGEGKTSITLCCIRKALQSGHPVLFLSFDQSEIQTTRQMVQQEHGVSMRRQRDHRQDKAALSDAELERCYTFSDWLDRQHYAFRKCETETGQQLAGIIRRWVKRLPKGHQTPLVVVDHVNAVTPEDRRAHEGAQVQSVTRPLKGVAGSTGCAVLALYQRNTKSGDRPNPRPIITDVNGGQPAIRDLDCLITLYRPWRFMGKVNQSELQGRELDQFMRVFSRRDSDGSQMVFTETYAELSALKVRFGRDDQTREIEFIPDRTLFKSLSTYQIEGGFL